MPDKQKNSKAGRQKKSGQNLKYKNEHRAEQNKLTRLKAHIKVHGITAEVKERYRLLQIALGHNPSDLKVDRPKTRSTASAAFHRGPFATIRPKQMREFGVQSKKAA